MQNQINKLLKLVFHFPSNQQIKSSGDGHTITDVLSNDEDDPLVFVTPDDVFAEILEVTKGKGIIDDFRTHLSVQQVNDILKENSKKMAMEKRKRSEWRALPLHEQVAKLLLAYVHDRERLPLPHVDGITPVGARWYCSRVGNLLRILDRSRWRGESASAENLIKLGLIAGMMKMLHPGPGAFELTSLSELGYKMLGSIAIMAEIFFSGKNFKRVQTRLRIIADSISFKLQQLFFSMRKNFSQERLTEMIKEQKTEVASKKIG